MKNPTAEQVGKSLIYRFEKVSRLISERLGISESNIKRLKAKGIDILRKNKQLRRMYSE